MTNLELPATLTAPVFEATGILFGKMGAVSRDMKPFIKEITPNGNPIFDAKQVLERLDVAGKMLRDARFPLVFAADERFKNALSCFYLATGIDTRGGRLLPGAFTNPHPGIHVDADILLVSDPNNGIPTKLNEPFTGDRRAMAEASSVGIPIIAICNSNASLEGVDLAIPANNLGAKAIATAFYVLAFSYLRGKEGAVVPPLLKFETPQEDLNTEKEDDEV